MDKTSDNNKDYFDPKHYNSIIIGEEEKKASAKNKASLVALLTDAHNRDVREDVLKLIKNEPRALEFLVDAIEDKKLSKYKVEFLSACWESGIDCRSRLFYFVQLALNSDYLSCIEAFSVVDGMDMPLDQQELQKSIDHLQSGIKGMADEKAKLLKELGLLLESYKE